MKPLTVGVVVAAVVLSAASGARVFGQRQGGTTMPVQPITPVAPTINSNRSNFPMGMGSPDPSMGIPDVLGGRMSELQTRVRNNERQKRLESDTEKLVGLVTDFKSQVQGDKSLSPAELSKRAEEIEKLARSVKDRMRG